jgi:hypothetical protein
LEDRTLPTSGITASLTGGILRITDYKNADTVVVHQLPTGVNVTATDTNLNYTSVNQITLDVRFDDTVTNNTSGLGSTPPRSVYLSRRDTTGAHFAASGNLPAGATSGPIVTPPPSPPPPNPDWFDRELNDAGLRVKARLAAGDGTIDRQDVLALFAQVELDGTVTANEIHDLQALDSPDWTAGGQISNPTPVFSTPNSVRGLLSDVANGDPANAHYQGTTLGNVQAGWSAAQFQKLVNKWFLGLDHPAAGGTYQPANGSLFVNGAAIIDVHQGNLSDCYYLAALGALALDRPATIPAMFTDNGDGTYTVRFFNNGVAKYVTVDKMLPTDSTGHLIYDGHGALASSSTNELWVALAEKAYAQMNEEGWLGHAASNSYSGIEEGYSDTAMMQIAGGNATWTSVVNASSSLLQSAVTNNKPTILNSRSSPGNGVVANHTYPVVGYDATTQKFNLSNPQGGFIQLTWTQIVQSFYGYWQLP